MRILYYSRPCFGDCDFPLIKALRAQGHKVTVLYSMSPRSLNTTVFDINRIYPKFGIFPISIYPELNKLEKYIPLTDIYIANNPIGRFGWHTIKLAIKELQFFKRGKYDIIHYVETPSLLHFLPLSLFRKNLVITIHDGKPHSGEENSQEDFRRRIIKRYVKKFIVLNNSEVSVFSQSYKVPLKNIYVSHLGYYEILRLYGDTSKQRENYILFFGRISPYKGIEFLLDAMEFVHQKYPNVKIIIAGSGKFYFDISKFKQFDYVEIRNRFIELTELADLIRGALFTVCPYTDATQSGVIYSSFALNTPVISTNVGGLPELVDDGYTGIIIPPKDTYALSSAILHILENPNVLNRMRENIKESAKSGKGSWETIANEYVEIYNK